MRRAQSILLVLALFASPLALLARASYGLGSECNNLCCLPHGSHGSHQQNRQVTSKAEGMACHHKDAGSAAFCAMRGTHQALGYGLLAPLPPTTISAFVRVPLPVPSRSKLAGSSESLFPGFIAAPFEPPRS
jgi:hypothetical protein